MFSLGVNYTKRNHVIICLCGFCFPKLRRAVGSLTVGVGGCGGCGGAGGKEGGPSGAFSVQMCPNANAAGRLLQAVRAAICHHNPS